MFADVEKLMQEQRLKVSNMSADRLRRKLVQAGYKEYYHARSAKLCHLTVSLSIWYLTMNYLATRLIRAMLSIKNTSKYDKIISFV